MLSRGATTASKRCRSGNSAAMCVLSPVQRRPHQHRPHQHLLHPRLPQATIATTLFASLAAPVDAKAARAIAKQTKTAHARIVGTKPPVHHHAIAAAFLALLTTSSLAKLAGALHHCRQNGKLQPLQRSSRLLLHNVTRASPAPAKLARAIANCTKTALAQVAGQPRTQMGPTPPSHHATSAAFSALPMTA